MYNKNSLVAQVLASGEVETTSHAERVVDTVLSSIKNAVKSGEKVSLAGFGIFIKKQVKSKKGRNPRTGEAITVKAHSKVKFTTALKFKQLVNSSKK